MNRMLGPSIVIVIVACGVSALLALSTRACWSPPPELHATGDVELHGQDSLTFVTHGHHAVVVGADAVSIYDADGPACACDMVEGTCAGRRCGAIHWARALDRVRFTTSEAHP